jgi:hypothetical protein
MTAETYHHPTRRELLAPMADRLVRVQAAADSVRSLADMRSTSNELLADALHALEHDLLLAARDAGNAAGGIAP